MSSEAPTQKMVSDEKVFDVLYKADKRETVLQLLTKYKHVFTSAQNRINKAFCQASRFNLFKFVQEFMITSDAAYKPNQQGINDALMWATSRGHTNIMEYLMTRHDGVSVPLPDQSAVDSAFQNTLGKIDLVRLLLTPHEGVPLPSETEIIAEYRVIIVDEDITPDNKRELLALLEPHVPEAERRAQQRGNNPGQGVAYRVHDYANTQVAVKSDESCSSTKTMRVNDAVLHLIENRLKGKTLANASEITTRLTNWIDAKYPEATKNDIAKQAMNYSWSDTNTPPRNLVLVFSFVKVYYPDSFDAWANGYLTESITAYESRNNPLSCIKGIDERIITGLRSIAPDIDALYETPERNEMVKSIFSNYNIGTSDGAIQVARVLLNHSITASNTAEEAVPIFEQFLTEKITSTGATPDPKNIENIVSTIRDGYDSIIKPALREQKRKLAANAAEARMKIKQK